MRIWWVVLSNQVKSMFDAHQMSINGHSKFNQDALQMGTWRQKYSSWHRPHQLGIILQLKLDNEAMVMSSWRQNCSSKHWPHQLGIILHSKLNRDAMVMGSKSQNYSSWWWPNHLIIEIQTCWSEAVPKPISQLPVRPQGPLSYSSDCVSLKCAPTKATREVDWELCSNVRKNPIFNQVVGHGQCHKHYLSSQEYTMEPWETPALVLGSRCPPLGPGWRTILTFVEILEKEAYFTSASAPYMVFKSSVS